MSIYFEYYCDYFGCGAAIVVVTNQQEIILNLQKKIEIETDNILQ